MLPPRLLRRWVSLLALLSGTVAGCCIIPTPEHALLEGRGKIEQNDIDFLEQRKTSREDILLRFGEPDLKIDNDRVLAYHWAVVRGYWFVGGAMAAKGGPIRKDYFLVIEFDDDGLLKRSEIAGSVWKSKQRHLDELKRGKDAAPGRYREVLVIDPSPRLKIDRQMPQPPNAPIRFAIGEFRHPGRDDGSAKFLGHKKAAFGVIVADVQTHRPFTEILASAVAAQLRFAGHNVVSQDAAMIVSGELTEFGVGTAVGLSSWDALGTIDITLKFRCASAPDDLLTRSYRSVRILKTSIGPSKEDFEAVVSACLEDIQSKLLADEEFTRLLINPERCPDGR